MACLGWIDDALDPREELPFVTALDRYAAPADGLNCFGGDHDVVLPPWMLSAPRWSLSSQWRPYRGREQGVVRKNGQERGFAV